MNNTTIKSAIETMKERHSVRKYTKHDMPQEDLQDILEATITAHHHGTCNIGSSLWFSPTVKKKGSYQLPLINNKWLTVL